ncbi:Palmitoyltransferase [Mycena chlorophos]|uniref:Palmitoyltransferase n=1 Tax=Mycena chlorophos TaxID=658473 RepID=A0A8H6SJY1_MYCCL|nr:Palmitoyltransferase [Mycena chlorophos]
MSPPGARPSQPPPPDATPLQRTKRHFDLCGAVSEATAEARERRAKRREKPQPWLVQKFMIPVVLGILGYAAYVYAGRFVRSEITGSGGRKRVGLGVGLLVPWCLLWLWTLWAYVKVVLTPPGNARDYVSKSPTRPRLPPNPMWDQWQQPDPERDAALASIEAGRIGVGGPSYEAQSSLNHSTDTSHLRPPPKLPFEIPQNRRAPRGRMPPTTAVLHPANRWCSKCEIVKPYRAHHCRICGTCILKFDHHCPWIGQCVGARNHKFFVNFNLASALLAIYTFVSLLGVRASRWKSGNGVDAQEVVIVGFTDVDETLYRSGLFLLFTSSLLGAHIRMILLAQTSVESIPVHTIKDREKAQLAADGWGFWEGRCADLEVLFRRRKREILASYDAEWGAPDTEGNIWWPGSMQAAWEDVMGDSMLGWIFPTGRPLGDGMSYEPNPRFDKEGRWRRRAEWPAELR